MPKSETKAEYMRRWWREHPEYNAEWKRENKKRHAGDEKWIAKYTEQQRKRMDKTNREARESKILAFDFFGWKCYDCGETDIDVIEFDHVRGEKLGNPAKLSGMTHFCEVTEKCEPVCANCHRRRTIARLRERRTGIPADEENDESEQLTAAYVLTHLSQIGD